MLDRALNTPLGDKRQLPVTLRTCSNTKKYGIHKATLGNNFTRCKLTTIGSNRISIVSILLPKYMEWKAGKPLLTFPEAQIAYWFSLRSSM